MRIVAGRLRGRRIEAPEGSLVRPTSDRARQALFNILEHGKFAAQGSPLAGAIVLDAFAGTGALGLEALSRGAEHAVFMEHASAVQKLLRANIASCGEGANATVLGADATAPPRASRIASLAFLDPPYGKGLAAPALSALRREGWLAPEALVVVEVAGREEFALPDGFTVADERRYGAARLIFLNSV
ncbi:MAG TPA: 16S rRNA (guanine(966)-N(2))-methyltransferase RsmD [Aliidongia sp.]|nr:16S rRNA (guanine(966)-N(2))-methyltransferase RsmD [Aliidongia sp.]